MFVGDAGANTVSRAGHYCCGAAGLLVTATVAFLCYPLLVVATRPLYLLSSTALTVAFVVAWFATWALFESVWVRRTGRTATD